MAAATNTQSGGKYKINLVISDDEHYVLHNFMAFIHFLELELGKNSILSQSVAAAAPLDASSKSYSIIKLVN